MDQGIPARSVGADRKTAEGSANSAAQEWRIDMKHVFLAFTAVLSLIAFVLIGATMINTDDASMLGWMIATLLIALSSAGVLRYECSK